MGVKNCQVENNWKNDDHLTVANRFRALILQHLIDKINFAMLAIIEVDYHGLLLFSSFGADIRIFMSSRNYQNILSFSGQYDTNHYRTIFLPNQYQRSWFSSNWLFIRQSMMLPHYVSFSLWSISVVLMAESSQSPVAFLLVFKMSEQSSITRSWMLVLLIVCNAGVVYGSIQETSVFSIC